MKPAVKTFLLFVLGLAVAAAAVGAVWLNQSASVPAAALQPQQPLSALSAALEDLGESAQQQEALLDALPTAVTDAGCDTLYFTANTAQGIGWKDRHFSMEPRLKHETLMGLATRSFDALDYLANACAKAGVRLVAVLDVDALAGDGLQGDAALNNSDLAARLQAAVRTLSEKYAVSAVVLRLPDAVSDSAVNRAALSGMARQCALPFGLELGASHPLLRTADAGADMLFVRVAQSADAPAAAALAASAQATGLPVVWKIEDTVSFSGAVYYAAGQGLLSESCVWAAARDAVLTPDVLQQLRAAADTAPLQGLAALPVPAVGQTLAVSYPAEGATLYTDTAFLMGTSDPQQQLTLDDVPVGRTSSNGTFGVLVSLKEGENTFVLAQGSSRVTLHLNRAAASGGGGGERSRDDTVKRYEGERVRITAWMCSVLSDPDDEDRILETAKQGGVAVVNRCTTSVRGGKYTYMYELTTGGWVQAAYCEAVTENIGPWPLGDLAVSDDGRDENILLVSGGQPLAYDSWDEENGVLTVTLANTQAEAAVRQLSSSFCGSVTVEPVAGGVQLTFAVNGSRQLWGYDVTYDAQGNTVLYLKGAPSLELSAAQPLRGAVVLLDPGHGQDDNGALGIAGALGGPSEKDVNLAVALAARARLQQMGATVVMTREDDTFLSLEERSRLAQTVRPDLFLAVHHNSIELTSDANRVTGSTAYYFTLQGKLLADSLLPQVTDAVGREDDGSHWSYFYVTRMTGAPAVLFEYGFLVNPAEYEACCDTTTILREGDATARGILDYFRARLKTE